MVPMKGALTPRENPQDAAVVHPLTGEVEVFDTEGANQILTLVEHFCRRLNRVLRGDQA